MHVKAIITIIQRIFKITELAMNKYGYPCKEVDSQKSLNTFVVCDLEILFGNFLLLALVLGLFGPPIGFAEYMFNSYCYTKDYQFIL